MIIRDLAGETVCEDLESGFFWSGKMTRIRKRFGPNDHFMVWVKRPAIWLKRAEVI